MEEGTHMRPLLWFFYHWPLSPPDHHWAYACPQWRLEVRQRGWSGRKKSRVPSLTQEGAKKFVKGGSIALLSRGPNLEGGQGPLAPMVQAPLLAHFELSIITFLQFALFSVPGSSRCVGFEILKTEKWPIGSRCR